jgi:DNA replication initiation complex subunit (GINS family)
MAEVKITYETLFDLLRREKSRSELQQFDSSFYQDVVSYLKEKKGTIRTEEHTLLFSRGEQEKIKIQIHNIQKILKELYEIREKKVINLSINKVRTESNLIDTSNLLPEEASLFNETCELLTKYKEGIINHVIAMELPVIDMKQGIYAKQIHSQNEERSEFSYENKEEENRKSIEVKEKENIFDSLPLKEEKKAEAIQTSKNSKNIKVKILNDLPKFMGQDKSIYGPYSKQDEVELPEEIINILLKKGRVEVL